MPVDHARRVIFIHVPKTGGTTIEALLGLSGRYRSPDTHRLFGLSGTTELQHLTAAQLSRILPPDQFGSYFKFAFVRNPWDRAVSGMLWRARFARFGIRDMRDYVDWAEAVNAAGSPKYSDVHALPQHALLTRDGKEISVDRLGRFERFAYDVREILADFLGNIDELPHCAASRGRAPYRDYYETQLAERVHKLYIRDIEAFGYSF